MNRKLLYKIFKRICTLLWSAIQVLLWLLKDGEYIWGYYEGRPTLQSCDRSNRVSSICQSTLIQCSTLKGTMTCSNHSGAACKTYLAGQKNLDVYQFHLEQFFISTLHYVVEIEHIYIRQTTYIVLFCKLLFLKPNPQKLHSYCIHYRMPYHQIEINTAHKHILTVLIHFRKS